MASLLRNNPELAKEWHSTQNGSLTPADLTLGSNKRVWWICTQGHEWQARVTDRNYRKTGCPYCSGYRVCIDNCLYTINPTLAREWHPTKNGPLTPSDVTSGSSKRAWWLCSMGHEWEALVRNRSRGHGCPYCAGRALGPDNHLQIINPELAQQWHPTKNDRLTPLDVTPNSDKKAWWICGKGHEWKATISNRNRGRGCPYCAGRAVCDDNCLQTLNPSLAAEWHPEKNGSLTPRDVMPGSSKRVWWRCEKGHEWEAVVHNRNSGTGCPYCAGRALGADNCLQAINPELAKQWHPTKNGRLTPLDVTPNSDKKAWWICGSGHEWKATISNRNRGRGCPYCAGRAVCDDNCLETVNPSLAAEWNPQKNGSLTPRDVMPGSSKRVWWRCEKGHEWEAYIHSRSKGYGRCPYCRGR